MIKLKTIAESISTVPQPTVQKSSQSSQTNGDVSMDVEQKKKLKEMVGRYNEYGKALYREKDLSEISEALREIAELAESYALNGCGDFIEEATVKRNMAELRKYNEMFGKIAKETRSRQQQLEALYEDMGRVLERYFEINESNN